MARSDELVIIEAAVNGVTRKAASPRCPESPAEIAADALAALRAGAAIVHNHNAEFAVDGARAAEIYLEAWRPVLRERPDAILYPTLGFGKTIEERYAHVAALAETGVLRMTFLDTGSVNLGGVDDEGLPGGADFVYVNSFGDIRYKISVCERYGLAPSIAIFEPGFLRTALAYERAGRMPKGAFLKLYFGEEYLGGAGFGLPPTRRALEAYLEMLEASRLPWAVAVLGGDVVESGMARLALERGGHVRVGLEDYGGPRKPANEQLVAEAVALARKVGRRVATPDEAAALLDMAAAHPPAGRSM
jgi:3-keto-5-aminohexanoate cleavage enzyme